MKNETLVSGATDLFNPADIIPIPQAPTEDFTELVEPGCGCDKEVKNELKTSRFGSINVQDFTDFNTKDYVPNKGEYKFSVEQKFLRNATSITRLTTGASKAAFGTVKVTIFENKLRLATFNQTIFSEVFIPLFEPSNVEPSQEISFIFDSNILAKIANTFVDAVITFGFNASKSLLIIKSDKTELELSTAPENDFVKYHSKIGEPKYINKVDPTMIKSALGYLGNFVKKDDVQVSLSIVQCREGMMVGGNFTAIGVFRSPAFEGLNFKVKYEIMKVLEQIAPNFHEQNTHLFESDNFYILRDENLYIGFEKTTYAFPPLDGFFKAHTTGDITMVPRSHFLNSLEKLSVVSMDRDLIINCHLSGSGNEGELKLVTKDQSGKESKDVLQVYRGYDSDKAKTLEQNDFPDRSFNLNLTALIKVVSHFESANIAFKEIPGKAVLINDEDKTYNVMTILSILAEKKAEKEQAKSQVKSKAAAHA